MNFVFSGHPRTKDNFKGFNRFSGRPYLSQEFKQYERSIQYQILAQLPKGFQLLIAPLVVTLKVFLAKGRSMDAGNAPKSCLDACNGYVWKDDKQIYDLRVMMFYRNDNPRIEMIVTSLNL